MSNLERIENLKQLVRKVQPDFETLAKIHNAVHYEREAAFACQILTDNYYLQTVALADQDSLKRAVLNVAAVGLTLNPVLKLAYLVPRDKKVCLDISYVGYIHLATEAGAIKWAAAEVVMEKDKFTFNGHGKEPEHKFDPFADRGKIIGAYCIAKTHGNEFIVTPMSIDDIYDIRDRSMSWRAYVKDNSKTSPWNTDEKEMIKKTVIRRAYKMWPKTDSSRFQKALELGDAAIDVQFTPVVDTDAQEFQDGLAKLRASLVILGRSETALLDHLVRANRRDIKKLEDLTPIELGQANVLLDQMIEKKKAKEAQVENAG